MSSWIVYRLPYKPPTPLTKMQPLRPVQYLAHFNAKYPNAWSQIASFHALKGTSPDFEWRDCCYVPLAGAYAAISGGGPNRLTPGQSLDVGIVGGLAAWRLTKGIYRFDATIFDAVWDTPADKTLPVELFYKLPEWCVYIEVPPRLHGGYELHGFFVFVEHDANTGRPELRFLLDTGDSEHPELVPLILHLTHDTLEACFAAALGEAQRQMELGGWSLKAMAGAGALDPAELDSMARELGQILPPLLSLTLYLCSATVEMRDARNQRQRPENPLPKRIKGEDKILAAPQPTVWETGYRMGAALRGALAKARAEAEREGAAGSSATKAPHVRRAHWHTFLTGEGSRRDPTKAVRRLKWLPPVPVGIEDTEDLPATIHPVK